MEKPTSILPDDLRGVMKITGYPGIGKTYLASQADLPQNIIFLDMESKGAGVDSQLNFGAYHPITQQTDDPQKTFEIFQFIVEKIEDNQYTTLIIDNVSPLENAMNAEASRKDEYYAAKYGLNLKNIRNSRFGGTKSVVNFMISDITAKIHSKGVDLIIITSHIKSRWSTQGIIPNKYASKGANRWNDLSVATIILIPGATPPIPDALIQKEQLGIITFPSHPTPEQIEAMKRGEAGHKVKRRLPPKITECTFQKLRWYLQNPVDFNDLKDYEVPSEDEINPFREKLNKEEYEYVMNLTQYMERESADEEEVLQNDPNEILMLEEMNNVKSITPPAVVQHMKEQGFECDIPKALVLMSKFKNQ